LNHLSMKMRQIASGWSPAYGESASSKKHSDAFFWIYYSSVKVAHMCLLKKNRSMVFRKP